MRSSNQTAYSDDSASYKHRLDMYKLKELEVTDPTTVAEFNPLSTSPYSLNIAHGYPIFSGTALQDCEKIILSLQSVLPNNFFNPVNRTHITMYLPFGGRKREENPPSQEFINQLTLLAKSIKFKPFSLKVYKFVNNGIILWIPHENKEEIFNIRKQLFNGLIKLKGSDKPPIMQDIIHTTILRVSNKQEWLNNFSKYIKEVADINKKIEEDDLFSVPVEVNSLKFVMIHFSEELYESGKVSDKVLYKTQAIT